MKLSVLMPVYNERDTISAILDGVRKAPIGAIEKEIVVVDDFSSDGTRDILQTESAKGDIKLVLHPFNQGKGAAVKTALQNATGDVLLIQDADLEYDPNDYAALLAPIVKGRCEVVYGSRFRGKRESMMGWHAFGNRFLTTVANILYGTHLTDMETCYKVFTARVKKGIDLRSPRWGFDPEITAQILRQGFRVREVPISYRGREFAAGKKISWRDGFIIVWTLVRYRFGIGV